MNFNEEGVELQNDLGSKTWSWKLFSKFLESPYFFHLYFDTRSFFLVPKDAFKGISDLQLNRRKIVFTYPFGPSEVVEHFRKYFGPTQKQFEMLDENGQAALRSDLAALWESSNSATDGDTAVESEYLEVLAKKA